MEAIEFNRANGVNIEPLTPSPQFPKLLALCCAIEELCDCSTA